MDEVMVGGHGDNSGGGHHNGGGQRVNGLGHSERIINVSLTSDVPARLYPWIMSHRVQHS